MRSTWTVDRLEVPGVTLVALRVRNETSTARRVRVRNALDGPAWPPRREGYPAAGWDETGFEGVVDAGAVRALGYASPAPAADPPATVTDLGPAEGTATGEGAADVVRRLGDPRPPRAAIGVPADREPRAVRRSDAERGPRP